MRIFFVTFIFIAIFSLYSKIAPLFLSTDSSIPKEKPFSVVAIVKNNKKVDKKIDRKVDEKMVSNFEDNFSKNSILLNSNSNNDSNKKLPEYKDGEYKGDMSDAYYGYVQVEIIIREGKISDIKFLKFPNSNQNSVYLSSRALPYLKQEVVQSQSVNVDVVSGATYTSLAFMQSTESAFLKALN